MIASMTEKCFKHACERDAVTWEYHRHDGFPSALCDEHAARPERRGTFERPTPVPDAALNE